MRIGAGFIAAFFLAAAVSCGGGGSSTETSPPPSAEQPEQQPAGTFIAQVTSAPDEGAIISGLVNLEVKGSNITDIELLPAEGYSPKLAAFAVSADKTTATASFDTTKLPDGSVSARISAFYTPAGGSDATEITVMPARTWTIQNVARPLPDGFSAQLVSAPVDGVTLSGVVTLEVSGTNLKNVELLPADGYVPRLAVFAVSSDGTRATATIDTATLADGPLVVRICAFDAPSGMPANEIVAMASRTWTVRNKQAPASFSAQVTNAPADGATISGKVSLEVTGTGIENAELLPQSGYTPQYAVFSISPDKTRASVDFDTTKLSNGKLAVRITAFNAPAGSSTAGEIVAMATRTWNIQNTTWSIADLGTLGEGAGGSVNGINDSGEVVINTTDGSGTSHAFLYSNGSRTALGTLGGASSYASAINNSGHVVGRSSAADGFSYAFLYKGGGMSPVSGPGYTAYGINEQGDIAGVTPGSSGLIWGSHAFLLSNGVMTDLGVFNEGAAAAVGINNAGQIIITLYVSTPGRRAVLYQDGKSTDLGELNTGKLYIGTVAFDINNKGQVVGSSNGYAFSYSNGAMTDIGAGYGSFAYGVNDSGRIVGAMAIGNGNHAYLYSDGAISDLNSLSEVNAAGWTLTSASAINSSGQIVGQGINKDGQVRAFLLTPPKAP